MTQSQRSKLVDPFQGQCILSLHPRRFRDSKVSLKSNDIEAIHQLMSPIVLQNPDNHFEEAKSIIDGVGSEFLSTKENTKPNMKEDENRQKNRPALARKRAKFSMKPDTSQPYTVEEPTFQMDQLHDPEEFFAAYEKFENTVKELRRQRGEDQNESKVPTTARQRRPEIQRRKASYHHHVYSSQPENDTLFSQETSHDTFGSQPIPNSQHESATRKSHSKEKDIDESITKSENKLNKLFDDLMSSNIVNLDENEALSFLQDRLKIKRVTLNDLQLPDSHEIPRVDFSSSVNWIKDQNILLDTQAFSGNLEANTTGKLKKSSDNLLNTLSSPTPPRRSPLLAISTFGKLISKSVEIESDDPFSPRDKDLFPTTSGVEINSGPSTHASIDEELQVSASKDDLTEPPISMEDREQLHNVEEMDENMQENPEDVLEKAASPTKLNLNVEDITDNLHCELDMGENIEDATGKVVSSGLQEENIEIATIQESESNCFQSVLSDQTVDTSINVPDASLPVQNSDTIPEQQIQEHPKTSINSRKKTRARKTDPKKNRHSLIGAGSCLKAGVRRSNRIKSKPLEYWKGERLLYARVHNSLPTVVGVKYLSATNSGGEGGFKVESFVADEYKDLVDLISLH